MDKKSFLNNDKVDVYMLHYIHIIHGIYKINYCKSKIQIFKKHGFLVEFQKTIL